MRPYSGYYYNLGRETFLAPVCWEDGFPIVSPGTGRVEFEYSAPNLPEHVWTTPLSRDDFNDSTLAYQWNFLRTPREDFYSLSERKSFLRLRLRPQQLSEQTNPSFVGRRQQHINFTAQTAFEFTPQSANECAGLVLIQNNDFHFRFLVTYENGNILSLIQRLHGYDETLATQPLPAGRYTLKVTAHEQNYNFYFSTNDQWHVIAENVDGRILSTPVAGGFVGAYIAMYASSNGQPSTNRADFDWFDYSWSQSAS
jgi:xylan 1,4-beta-xylosidase